MIATFSKGGGVFVEIDTKAKANNWKTAESECS